MDDEQAAAELARWHAAMDQLDQREAQIASEYRDFVRKYRRMRRRRQLVRLLLFLGNTVYMVMGFAIADYLQAAFNAAGMLAVALMRGLPKDPLDLLHGMRR